VDSYGHEILVAQQSDKKDSREEERERERGVEVRKIIQRSFP